MGSPRFLPKFSQPNAREKQAETNRKARESTRRAGGKQGETKRKSREKQTGSKRRASEMQAKSRPREMQTKNKRETSEERHANRQASTQASQRESKPAINQSIPNSFQVHPNYVNPFAMALRFPFPCRSGDGKRAQESHQKGSQVRSEM